MRNKVVAAMMYNAGDPVLRICALSVKRDWPR
jgi:hypothetical protein